MRRACGQAADDATFTEHDALDGIVVCQHGNHGFAAAGVRHAGGGFRSLCNERFDPRACPVVDGHVMAGLQEVRRHAGAHVPQSDESDLHGNTSLLFHLTPDILVFGVLAHLPEQGGSEGTRGAEAQLSPRD